MQPGSADPLPRAPRCIAQRVLHSSETQTGRAIDRAAARQRHHRRYVELVEAQAILPGVQNYLEDAQRLGLKLGVASSGTRDWCAVYPVRRSSST